MMAWLVALVALAAGAALALLTYRRGRPWRVALLRAVAAAAITALLLNAPLAPARPVPAWIAVDVSASWASEDDPAGWAKVRASVDSLRAAGADSLLLFGDSLRGDTLPARPADTRSRVEPLVEAARALGRPAIVVTDGRLADAERLAELPRGSAVVVHEPAALADLAIGGLEAPRAAVIGDTVEMRVLLQAGGAAAGPRILTITLAGRRLATAAVPALGSFAEREERLRVVIPALEGDQPLVVALDRADARARNDTARVPLSVVGTARVALVSTSPDQDARFALTVLRGTQRAAVRAYWRVAPGQWREGPDLRAVREDVVRRALRDASLAVLHGDTAYFGAPRAATRAALVLMPTPPGGPEEHYAVAAGDSPLRPLLGDFPWENLPPLAVGSPAPASTLPALLARRARRTDERAVVALREGPPRVVIVPAAGFWRWRTRGGRPAAAFDALWGSIFDWVTATPRTPGTAVDGPRIAAELVPSAPTVRSGPVGEGPVRDLAPRAREAWWLALLALLALCVEWVLRRRIGWR